MRWVATGTRAIAARTTLRDLLAMTSRLRLRAPVVTMGYMNPIEAMGSPAFARALRDAGLCGAIVPDLPLEEAGPLRAAQIASVARGFLYYVSVTGVTGARSALPRDLDSRLAELRALSPAPVVVGFGISRPEHAAALKGKADGGVVGSALVTLHHEGGG